MKKKTLLASISIGSIQGDNGVTPASVKQTLGPETPRISLDLAKSESEREKEGRAKREEDEIQVEQRGRSDLGTVRKIANGDREMKKERDRMRERERKSARARVNQRR